MKKNRSQDKGFVTDPYTGVLTIITVGIVGGVVCSYIIAGLIAICRPVVAAIAKIFGASIASREFILSIDPFILEEPTFWIFFILIGGWVLWQYLSVPENVNTLIVYIVIVAVVFAIYYGHGFLNNLASFALR